MTITTLPDVHPGRDGSRARLILLGPPGLERGRVVSALGLPARAVVLLAYLALHAERALPRERVAAALWPDACEADARANLRRYLHVITHAAPEFADAFELTKTTVRWSGTTLGCDALDFDRIAGDLPHSGEALRLYRGELCEGIDDESLAPLRDALEARFEAVLRRCLAIADEAGDRTEAAIVLQRLVERNPYDEGLVRRAMGLRREGGDRAGALRDYHALVARLRTDLDIEPEVQTRELLEDLLAGDVAAGTPHNLVAPGTSLVGRGTELRAVAEALGRERLVSIVGGAGIGKTRLAIEAAFVVLDRFERVWFVDLARALDVDAAFGRIADAIGAVRTADPSDGIAAVLHRAGTLVVLDNLEQLGAAARTLAERLLARSNATFAATSRRRTDATGEFVVTLGPLDIPPAAPAAPEALARYGAVRLFLERATKAAPSVRIGFENVRSLGRIARQLDGVPLAIELVASRANLLTIDGIAKRLDDHAAFADQRRGERHTSIEAAIAWSYDLLAPAERSAFRAIAVFGETWSAEAFEEVCVPAGSGDAVALASELVESSLVTTEHRPEGVRYRAYETTRRFAAARLDEAGERDACATRHLEHVVRFAERAERDFDSEREPAAFARCDAERGTVDVALAWALERDPPRAARVIAALWRYWIFRGRAEPALRAFAALEHAGNLATFATLEAARTYFAAGSLAREVAFARAQPYLERALTAFRTCGDEDASYAVRAALAAVAFTRGDFAVADAGYTACLAYFEKRGDERAAAGALANLAQLAWAAGKNEEALRRLERARVGFEATANLRGIAHVFRTRAMIYGALGRHAEAVAQAREGVALYERLGERMRVAEALTSLSDTCLDAGAYAEAFEAAIRSLELLREVPHDVWFLHVSNTLSLAATRTGDYENALRLRGASVAQLRRLGRSSEGLEAYAEGETIARSSLSHAVADAAFEAGATFDIADCLAIAKSLHRAFALRGIPESRDTSDASDDRRTVGTVP